ncbi:transporter [Streptococcus pneumoniae]|nr:transporter [Streptococcus pneumoniae]
MPNLKKNIVYNVLYQILAVIVPFIISPYLARVLGAEQIGVYSFTYSIAFYFMILSMLGISNYGNRTIAQVRTSREHLNQEFSNIYAVQLTCSLVMTVSYLIYATVFVNSFQIVAYIQVLHVLSYATDVSWFFYGLEEFRITVARNSFVKLLTLISIFTFVKSPNDIYLYTFIMAGSTLLGQLITWQFLLKQVNFVRPNLGKIKKHMKPIIILFFPVLAVSIFSFLDKIMLGMYSSLKETAFYENSDKIISIPKALIQAFGAVMLPRTVHLLSIGDEQKSLEYVDKTMWVVLVITMGCAFGLAGVSATFAPVYWGEEFRASSQIIAGMTPALVFSAFGNVIRTQFLIPRSFDKEYTVSLLYGAVVNILINILLIPKMGAMGAVIGIIVAELVLCCYQTWIARNYLHIREYLINAGILFLIGSVMYMVLILISSILPTSLLTLIIEIIVGAFIYISLLVLYIFSSKNRVIIGLRTNFLEHTHLFKRK